MAAIPAKVSAYWAGPLTRADPGVRPTYVIVFSENQYSTAAATAFDTRRSSRPLSIDHARLVRITQSTCVSGSAQATVPVAPEWPKVRGDTRSPNPFQATARPRAQPSPHGALRFVF